MNAGPPYGPLPRLLQSERPPAVLLCSVNPVLTARSRLPSPGGAGEDAPVEVLETRMRSGPKASRHRLTSEAIIAVLLEVPRS
jgi:hypothetical protein